MKDSCFLDATKKFIYDERYSRKREIVVTPVIKRVTPLINSHLKCFIAKQTPHGACLPKILVRIKYNIVYLADRAGLVLLNWWRKPVSDGGS